MSFLQTHGVPFTRGQGCLPTRGGSVQPGKRTPRTGGWGPTAWDPAGVPWAWLAATLCRSRKRWGCPQALGHLGRLALQQQVAPPSSRTLWQRAQPPGPAGGQVPTTPGSLQGWPLSRSPGRAMPDIPGGACVRPLLSSRPSQQAGLNHQSGGGTSLIWHLGCSERNHSVTPSPGKVPLPEESGLPEGSDCSNQPR